MSEIIYKPYLIISKEWKDLCNQHSEALKNLFEVQGSSIDTYPSDQWWDKLESAQIEYEKIRTEMDHYRKTVKISV